MPRHALPIAAARRVAALLLLSLAMLAGAQAARAGDHRYDVSDPRYRDECGSCHLPYPPALLSAAQWQAVMTALDRHYGVDASIDARSATELTRWLAARACRDRGTTATTDLPRITTTRWFRQEHREAQPLLAAGKVKRAADCAACHGGAERGDYAERGLTPLAAQAR